MKITYTNTLFDIFRFNIGHQFRHPVYQAFIIAVGLFGAYSSPPGSAPAFRLMVAVFTYFVVWLGTAVFTLVVLGLYRDKTIVTRHSLTASEDGLHESTPYSETVTRWSAILRAVDRRSHLAIYVSQHAAHVVPFRAFADEQAMLAFLKHVRSLMASAAVANHGP